MENQSHPDFKKNKINRKQFLRLAGLVLLIPLFRLWQVTVDKKRGEAKSQIREIVIQPDLHDGVHFFENVILSCDCHKGKFAKRLTILLEFLWFYNCFLHVSCRLLMRMPNLIHFLSFEQRSLRHRPA